MGIRGQRYKTLGYHSPGKNKRLIYEKEEKRKEEDKRGGFGAPNFVLGSKGSYK